MTSAEHDLVVLGGGAAALAAARNAVAAGARTLMITEGPPGGDCTFTGCVPSKTLIEAAADGMSFDEAMARMRATVSAIAATENEHALRAEGIEVIRGQARFLSHDRIDVHGRALAAPRIVIATGAAPSTPPISGIDAVSPLTTDTVFDLTEAPESLAILGAGATGCELAQAFNRLGVRVSLIESAHRILPGNDPEVSEPLTEILTSEGVAVHTETQIDSVHNEGDALTLHAGSTSVTARRLLVAVGRTPTTGNLGLERAGVDIDDRGFVITDKHMATTAPGIYAAGDVTGLFGHTHAAYAMGRVAVGSALRRVRSPTFSTEAIPRVVFTDPEIATIGRLEHELSGSRCRVAYLPMSEVDRASTANATAGFVKLIAGPRPVLGNAGGGKLLGATIVAERAGELIGEAALAMSTGMFTGRLAQTVHAYPTWSIALQQAAAQFFGGYGGRSARKPSADVRATLDE